MKGIDPNFDGDSCEQRAHHALRWMRAAGARDELLRALDVRLRRKRARNRFAACATLALVTTVAAFSLHRSGSRVLPPEHVRRLPTVTVDGPRTQRLPDGTTARLRDGAEIQLDYSTGLRRVLLLSGEAHFGVMHDAERPFVVVAGDVSVEALGTAFSVAVGDQGVDVLVTTGRVQVKNRRPDSPPGAAAAVPMVAEVAAGGRCLVRGDSTPQVEQISRAELMQRLAWRVPELEFSRTPLPEVVALINEHSGDGRTLSLGDYPELRAIRLSGYLRGDNIEGLLEILETRFGVPSVQHGNRIELQRPSRNSR